MHNETGTSSFGTNQIVNGLDQNIGLTYLSSTKIQFTSTEDLHSSYIHMRGSDPRSMNYGLSSSQLHLFVVLAKR